METAQVLTMLRKNKGLTQADLAAGITTRRAIIDAEHGNRDLSYETMMQLIERLGVSANDFEDYRHDHQIPADQALVIEFEQLSDTSETQKLNDLLTRARQLVATSTLRYTHQLIPILEALLHLDSYSHEKLTQLVQPVWNELTTIKEWNRTDLFLINNLLYIFAPQVAQRIGKKVIARLEHYSLQNILLKNAIYANLAFLGMQHPNTLDPATTAEYLKQSIALTKTAHRYDLHLLSQVRLAVLQRDYEHGRELCKVLKAMGADNVAQIAYDDFPILLN
ncbi:helix-turn-helix transcriptional regulator [Lactiplantibacillus fabifermentans]|uniref:HTH cro/C1-type domain-containing protein n=2 Tax=Lactiplantibacillus fabifermentans TaxID=483011 RepID=A0A0R2NRK6_9LACO|nr:helix-turn-helix transcriptional regulator [Lactiplantibacillus fabifermentans]ETY73608.1 hypothetical protein LFAB_11500 [Lactiplantibacillus fabifermentans T30PCM01]KRO27056.1 hypothetical protein DY78_GL000385 [Lactiplantibacillus fabifermentans DSM 21115]